MQSECLPCCQTNTNWENEMNAWKTRYDELKRKYDELEAKYERLEMSLIVYKQENSKHGK